MSKLALNDVNIFYGDFHDAADREYPEQVDEIERDVAASRFVASDRPLFHLRTCIHVAQAALKLSLLRQRSARLCYTARGHDSQPRRSCLRRGDCTGYAG